MDNSLTKNRIIRYIAVWLALLMIPALFFLIKSGTISSGAKISVAAHNRYSEDIRVVAYDDYNPYSYIDENGKYQGRDVELAILLANRMKYNLDIELMPYEQALEEIRSGKADLLLTEAYQIEPGDGYLRYGITGVDEFAIFSKEKETPIEALRGKSIAVMENANVIPYLHELSLFDYCDLYESNRAALEAVEAGKADYAIVRKNIGNVILSQLRIRDVAVSGSIAKSYLSFGMSYNGARLQQKLSTALRELSAEGEMDRLDEKWLTTNVQTLTLGDTISQNIGSTIIVLGIFFILAILIVGIDADARAKKKVHERETKLHEALSALSADFDLVDYVKLTDFSANDITLVLHPTEKMLQYIPELETETNFHNRLELLNNLFVSEPDRKKFYAATRREIIKENLEKNNIYETEFLSNVTGKSTSYQLRFVGDRDESGKLVAFTAGLRCTDKELYAESVRRSEIEKTVALRTEELQNMNENLNTISNGVLELMGNLVESRSHESGTHIKRVKGYTRILAEEVMANYPEYGLTEKRISLITFVAALHDVGKIAIPDAILLKPGKLTPEEFDVIKTHTTIGASIIDQMAEIWNTEYISVARNICIAHHERWNGEGYPNHLAGDDIPIEAQIVAIADVYDAMTTERCYKAAYSCDEAYRIITEGGCGSFSEKMLFCLARCKEKFERYAAGTENADIDSIDFASLTRKSMDDENYLKTRQFMSSSLPAITQIGDSLPGGFFAYHADGNLDLIYFNDFVVKLFGCQTKEEFMDLTGNTFRGMIHSDDFEETNGTIAGQISESSEHIDHVVYRINCRDGSTKWIDDYGRLFHSDDFGDIFFVFVTDITEAYERRNDAILAQAQEEEKSKLSRLLETAESGEENITDVLRGMHILMVEDSAMTRELVKEILTDEGVNVTEASNGFDALTAIKRSSDRFDAILMDLMMPVMSGVAATKYILSYLSPRGVHTPIILLTSDGTDSQVSEAISAGAYEVMYKPLNITNLAKIMIRFARESTEMMERELERTLEYAHTDPLTGVGNLSAYTERITELTESLGQGSDIVVVFSDCDNLKVVNDTFGHSIGDAYIRNCCGVITKNFGRENTFRIGGDEFVSIITGSECAAIEGIMNTFRNDIAAAESLLEIPKGMAALSTGYAKYDSEKDEGIGETVSRADSNMYENKKLNKEKGRSTPPAIP